jgi:hypothetical protein
MIEKIFYFPLVAFDIVTVANDGGKKTKVGESCTKVGGKLRERWGKDEGKMGYYGI